MKGGGYQILPFSRPGLFLDRCLGRVGKLDGEAPLEGALGLFEEKDLVKDIAQEGGTAGVVGIGYGNFDSPVLWPAYLQYETVVVFIDTPTLTLGEDGLQCRTTA